MMKSAKQQIIDSILQYAERAGIPLSTEIEDPQTPFLRVSIDTFIDKFAKFRSEDSFRQIYNELKRFYPLPVSQ